MKENYVKINLTPFKTIEIVIQSFIIFNNKRKHLIS